MSSLPPLSPPSLRGRLRQALTVAMKERDTEACKVLRSVLAAVDNAEAAPAPDGPLPLAEGRIAGAAHGVGATEVARRHLSDDDVTAVVRAELAEREAAAAHYDELGRPDEAARLRAAVSVVARHLT